MQKIETNNPAIYWRIWKHRDENYTNLCAKCEHPLMYDIHDTPILLKKIAGRNHHSRYYHLEPCAVCNQICGELLYA